MLKYYQRKAEVMRRSKSTKDIERSLEIPSFSSYLSLLGINPSQNSKNKTNKNEVSMIERKKVKKKTCPQLKPYHPSIKLPQIQGTLDKKVYKFNKKDLLKIKHVQENNSFCFQESFNLKNYHNKLLKAASNSISQINLEKLRDNLNLLNNDINQKQHKKKTKWQNLANKLSNIAPKHLIEKLNSFRVYDY